MLKKTKVEYSFSKDDYSISISGCIVYVNKNNLDKFEEIESRFRFNFKDDRTKKLMKIKSQLEYIKSTLISIEKKKNNIEFLFMSKRCFFGTSLEKEESSSIRSMPSKEVIIVLLKRSSFLEEELQNQELFFKNKENSIKRKIEFLNYEVKIKITKDGIENDSMLKDCFDLKPSSHFDVDFDNCFLFNEESESCFIDSLKKEIELVVKKTTNKRLCLNNIASF